MRERDYDQFTGLDECETDVCPECGGSGFAPTQAWEAHDLNGPCEVCREGDR